MAAPAMAADALAAGKIKSINADKKDFVLTDSAGKDHTFKLGDKLVVNRAGKETKSDLNAGDAVNVCFDKGVLTWTAHYILVQEGDSKNLGLAHGTFKSYDAPKKEFSFTDETGKDWTYAMGNAKVRLNNADSKVEDMKIGDKILAIVETIGDKATLKSLMVERK
jgi:hypothetical protein